NPFLIITVEVFKLRTNMKRKLKILTVDRSKDDGYWIAGVFDTDEEIQKYIELYLFDDPVVSVEEVDYPNEIRPLPNGEYAYQVLVANPENFIVEAILPPERFTGFRVVSDAKSPTRIFIAAKNAAELKTKCLSIMADRMLV
ncbi:MAG: hypothetical protein ACQUHE_12750, partial [Bacteroidia bacterium]